jgi:hypothetical protein
MIVLANRPGFPFLGNDFYREIGDVFSGCATLTHIHTCMQTHTRIHTHTCSQQERERESMCVCVCVRVGALFIDTPMH